MGFLLIFFLLIIILIICKNEKILNGIKNLLSKCKWLIVFELLLIIIIGIFDNSVVIKEKNPHTNKILKFTILKEGDSYYYSKAEPLEGMSDHLVDIRKNFEIEKIGMTKITILRDYKVEEYKYGLGFRYYTLSSCKCGTPIIFEKHAIVIIEKIVLFSIIIDAIITFFVVRNKDKIEE